MNWGIRNRLARLIQKDGRALFLPIDHGYFQGPTHKLEKPNDVILFILSYEVLILSNKSSIKAGL